MSGFVGLEPGGFVDRFKAALDKTDPFSAGDVVREVQFYPRAQVPEPVVNFWIKINHFTWQDKSGKWLQFSEVIDAVIAATGTVEVATGWTLVRETAQTEKKEAE